MRSSSARPRPSETLRGELLAAARGFMGAQTLLAANELGFFAALAGRPLTERTLARRLACSRRGIRALADGLAAMGLIERRGERLAVKAAARDLLDPANPGAVVHLLSHQKQLYDRWAGLAQAVRKGGPVGRRPRPGAGRRRFVAAMAESSQPSIKAVLRLLKLSGPKRFLDLGGGPGSYAIACAKRWPRLDVVLFDQPGVIKSARVHLQDAGMEDRVSCLSGDARRDDLGGPYDAILISNVLHLFSPREMVTILRRAGRALAPGGVLLLKDFALDEDRRGPFWAGLFGLNMLVVSEHGGVYTIEQYDAILRRAGLRRVAAHPLGEASVVLVAAR